MNLSSRCGVLSQSPLRLAPKSRHLPSRTRLYGTSSQSQSLSKLRPHFKRLRSYRFSTSSGIRQASSSSPSISKHSKVPATTDRGPASSEDTQTDFSVLDVLSRTPQPAASIDACAANGFDLSNGLQTRDAGVLILGGEAFTWTPWIQDAEEASSSQRTLRLLNQRGQFETPSVRSNTGNPQDAWTLLRFLYPKPDIFILGVGSQMVPLSPATRAELADLGVRVEIADTRNAAAQYNLLATERGINAIGVGLVPLGWREGRGLVGQIKA